MTQDGYDSEDSLKLTDLPQDQYSPIKSQSQQSPIQRMIQVLQEVEKVYQHYHDQMNMILEQLEGHGDALKCEEVQVERQEKAIKERTSIFK